jgi:hypothetical protein
VLAAFDSVPAIHERLASQRAVRVLSPASLSPESPSGMASTRMV